MLGVRMTAQRREEVIAPLVLVGLHMYLWQMGRTEEVVCIPQTLREARVNRGLSREGLTNISPIFVVPITSLHFTAPRRSEQQWLLLLSSPSFSSTALRRRTGPLTPGDIATEVALLSRHLALPRRGHLEQAYNVVAYLKMHPYSKLVMDPTPLGHKHLFRKRFNTDADWFEFYGDVKEEIPQDAPKPMGKPVEITAYCDADHAGDKLTRRSHTGILIFVMSAPILWYSKRQATIESSTFGSEIVALRTCLELIKELRYKLRMMGVPLDGPAVVWCDNQSVAKGAAVPEAKLNKKHLGICYHAVREASAAKIWQVGFIKGEHNIADCLTKILSGTVLEKQVTQWMYRK